jgi:hypothetical protein
MMKLLIILFASPFCLQLRGALLLLPPRRLLLIKLCSS